MLNNHLFYIAFGYSVSMIIERFDFDAEIHYMSYSALYLFLAYLCSKSENKLILCYGITNIAALSLCIPLMFADVEFCLYLFHDATYGVGNIVIAIELLMIGFGGYNAIIYFIDNWRDNGYSWPNRYNFNSKEV